VQSVLALPLHTHGKALGLVYLENNLVSHAFHAERVEVLRALVAQAAISTENALLYRGLESEVEEHKCTEKQLRAYAAELEQFTYTVSHDLKSPLVTIRGFLGLLRRDAETGDAERLEDDLSNIERATDTMAVLLSDLLDLSRVGRLDGPPVAVAMSDVAREAVQRLAGPITERGAEVGIEPAMPEVFGDRRRLAQLWLNLIENAVKFTDEQPRPRIDAGCRREGKEIVFFVRDNGRGIESSYREKVFGLFEQLDPAREGTGVGLALVRRIVEVHGGRVWVESAGRGKGSSLCFTLRLAAPKDGR